MTHPNFQTNGASLEDCHTNFFALTELSGIKWRKLTWSEPGGGSHGPGHGAHHQVPGEPLDDPVLRSYARCLAADILCVWRRVSGGPSRPPPDAFEPPPPPAQPPPLSLASAKELWIFWYGEEPDLNELVAPELNMSDCEQGSWESGLSYECRSLLFKALHNLIERCLLSRDFIRLGKWFVHPYDYPAPRFDPSDAENVDKELYTIPPPTASHLSFSFAFFVHGESSVCASVDVRQHPPVRRLTRWHMQEAQANTGGIKVILAPFGLAGTLTGQSSRSPESTAKFLDDWSHFYPLDKSSSLTDSSVVEVVVGGAKMRYPSCYVMVTDLDDNGNQILSGVTNGPSATTAADRPTKPSTEPCLRIPLPTPPASPNVQINSRVPQLGPHTVSVEHINSMSRDTTAAQILPERTWQQCLCCPAEKGTKEEGNWDFADPTRKANCTCVKPRKYISSSSSTKWCNSMSLLGQNPLTSRPQKPSKNRVPFHRRSPTPKVDSGRPPTPQSRPPVLQAQNLESRSNLGGSYTPQGGPPSYPRTQESMIVNSVGSPASVAPSPLQGPHSQPASVPPADATMPTLSPNPPISDQSPSLGVDKSHTPPDSVRLPPKSVESPAMSPGGVKSESEIKSGDRRTAEVSEKSNGGFVALKRPVLSSKEYEVAMGEEEHTLDMLYDYSTQDAWFNHPVKRFKPDGKENKFNKKTDLYSMYQHNGISQSNDITSANTIKLDIKQEVVMTELEPMRTNPQPHGVKRPGDPYEFEEDGNNPNNCKIDGFTRAPPIKEEPKDKKDNLLTIEGLQPSYDDLNQIFDNSDYTSSDEACFPQIQIQTPPSSAGAPTNLPHDDPMPTKRLSGHGQTNLGGCPNVGMPPELSKMFPTPPSLEHNPIASPCGPLDIGQQDYPDLSITRIKQDIYPMMGSPQEENIVSTFLEDWSFVFKPPTICKMVGSSKYAPLTNLPSQAQPIPGNCVYKPSWVQHMENSKHHQQQNANSSSGSGNNNNNGGTSNLNVNRNRTPTPSIPNNVHQNAGIFPPSPLHPPGFRPPPPPYELPSPANSNASSYLNKNLNSVEPVPTPQPTLRTPEASSLVLNILLTDTVFNIFRDHNFDSCTLCVCNASPKVVGNIRGADAGIYLLNSHSDKLHACAQPTSPYPGMGQPPPYGSMMSPQHHSEEDPIRCSCGFSAVVNRRLAYGSGLFYEDEMEITGIAEDPGDRKKSSLLALLTSLSWIKADATVDRDQLDSISHNVLDLICNQLVFIPNTANALCRAARYVRQVKTGPHSNPVHVLEFSDSNEVTCIALEQSKNLLENLGMCKLEDRLSKLNNSIGVHRWPFLRAPGPQCNQDIVRVMKSLQPLLQDAIQKKCQTRLWEAPSAVKGPLTWRQFHRLAGRGTDDRCEPQPIPSVIVGHDKDWLCLSPYAIQHWESLMLEPYSYSRDVAYVVVAPDNDAILSRVKTFFKELSTAYEICKLGRHSPITKVLRDGILRVGKTAKNKIGNEPVEEWFSLLGEGEASDMLKLYAQVCKHHLAPHLQQVPMDKTLLDPPTDNSVERPAPSPMPPPSTPDPSNGSQPSSSTPDKAPSTPKSDQDGDGLKDNPNFSNSSMESSHDDDDREAPSVVVYLVEPFSLNSNEPDMQRLAVLALLKCFQSVLAAVPENIRSNISVQIISLESIVELNKARERMRHSDHMRALALNIFSQCRRQLIHSNNVKSLTGFGTAATADLFLKNKDEKNKAPYKLFTPPYVLAPMRERVEGAEAFGKGSQDQSSVLYISYCLSEDQSWLLAVGTDERGEIFETVTINIDIPNRSRRKRASARRIGLEKLMTFILGVMSQSVRPWRLVVGRLGRIGHGELKGWSWLLSKKNLLKASRHLKELCNQCSMLYPSAVPCILSACLVSLEPDSALRLMPDQFTPDERFSQASVNSQLSTPQDISCTHILVFPTSATTQSSQTTFHEQQISGDLADDEFFKGFADEDITEGMVDNDIEDILNWDQIGYQSPTREDAGASSPTTLPCGMDGNLGPPSSVPKNQEPSEEVGVVLQQPLALGYLVSTAPTGRMPRWFWTSCPHLEGVCPAFLKNALHLHSPNIQQSSDDLFQQSAQVSNHPLDSQFTTDVLRYVLEGYNALSWLALDSNTKDRLSCLPVHMQVLVQLYHTAAALL